MSLTHTFLMLDTHQLFLRDLEENPEMRGTAGLYKEASHGYADD